MTKIVGAHEMNLGDRFYWDCLLWQHCGWYSAVGHIAGWCLSTDERRVISRHSRVELFEETFSEGLGI